MLKYILVFMFFIVSCAKPNYVPTPGKNVDGISGECEIYFAEDDVCLRTEWEQKPTESTFGSMLLKFYHKDHPETFISPTHTPFILLWMPSMGHGSSPVTMTFIEEGVYRASDIFFIMPGPWDIRYQLKNGNDVVVEQIQKITI